VLVLLLILKEQKTA